MVVVVELLRKVQSLEPVVLRWFREGPDRHGGVRRFKGKIGYIRYYLYSTTCLLTRVIVR